MWLHNCKIKFANSVGASMFAKLPESKPTSCLALEVMVLICLDQERSAEMVSPKYLILSTKSTGGPFRSKGLGVATCFLLDRIMALHYRGLKGRLTELAQRTSDVLSSCRQIRSTVELVSFPDPKYTEGLTEGLGMRLL